MVENDFLMMESYARKVDMKTVVSTLSVACHQRSGKYRTYREENNLSQLMLLHKNLSSVHIIAIYCHVCLHNNC